MPTIADRQLAWMDHLPAGLRACAELARWDRPIGTWLLLWPCWWGVALAPGLPDIVLLALFAIGAIAMRGAGCTINDMADRDVDAMVERTRHRPLASGRISMRGAVLFLIVQLVVGLGVLLTFNWTAVIVGLGIMPIVIAYPFAKRFTDWPQIVLGLAFNWGALVGWVAVTGSLAPAAFVLYAGGILWTLGYDTIYAHQDKDDDALVGVRSTALLFGSATPAWILGFYGGAVVMFAVAGYLAGLGPVFYAGLAVAAWHMARQARNMKLDDASDCLARFRANRMTGLLVFLAILAGRLSL